MKSISVIGGDKRNEILANLLEKDGEQVYNYGLISNKFNLEECIEKSDIIISSIPFSFDMEYIYMPLSNQKVRIDSFVELTKCKKIVAGKIASQVVKKLELNNNQVIDIMENEELAIMNSIPTAEGVVKILIDNTDITIHNSKIAILGFGRIGKTISKVLYGMGAKIFSFDINKKEVANINLCGYNVIENIYSLNDMDIIVNTIPKEVINEEVLKSINKNTIILDVSSKPGGVDFKYAKENNYKVIHALGLPGKIAPYTSAIYIKKILKSNNII